MTQPVEPAEFKQDITLPSGGTVHFRDLRGLKAKDKHAVIRSVREDSARWARGLDTELGTICVLTERWDLPYLPGAPLPKDEPGLLGELSLEDEPALRAAIQPAMRVLFPSESPTVPAGD